MRGRSVFGGCNVLVSFFFLVYASREERQRLFILRVRPDLFEDRSPSSRRNGASRVFRNRAVGDSLSTCLYEIDVKNAILVWSRNERRVKRSGGNYYTNLRMGLTLRSMLYIGQAARISKRRLRDIRKEQGYPRDVFQKLVLSGLSSSDTLRQR